eukprot:scaffold55917_cov33-Tisochrysis_lutea.AAC.1
MGQKSEIRLFERGKSPRNPPDPLGEKRLRVTGQTRQPLRDGRPAVWPEDAGTRGGERCGVTV